MIQLTVYAFNHAQVTSKLYSMKHVGNKHSINCNTKKSKKHNMYMYMLNKGYAMLIVCN